MARAVVTLALGGASVALLYLLWHRRRKASAARNETGDEEDGEVLEPGMILLEYARDVPELLPIAFLVHAIVKEGKKADEADVETARFTSGIEALEVLLLQASALPPAVLSRLAAALESAEATLRSSGPPEALSSACAELQACIDSLEYDAAALADADIDPTGLFGGAMAAAIEGKRRAQAADEQAARVLAERNRLLAEQVAQMQRMLNEQQQQIQLQQTQTQTQLQQQPPVDGTQLSAQEFFNYFPVPPDEAERRLLLQTRCIDRLQPPLPPLDAALRPVAEGGLLGPGLRGLLITLMADSEQRVLALLCLAADGTWKGSEQIGIGTWAPIPRKLTNCQYVVASGEVECVSSTSGRLLSDERRRSLMPSLATADPAIADALAPGGYIAMLQAHGERVAAGGGTADPMLSLALDTVSRNHQYVGAPIRLQDGCVVGALCGMFSGSMEEETPGVRATLQKHAGIVARLLEGLCS